MDQARRAAELAERIQRVLAVFEQHPRNISARAISAAALDNSTELGSVLTRMKQGQNTSVHIIMCFQETTQVDLVWLLTGQGDPHVRPEAVAVSILRKAQLVTAEEKQRRRTKTRHAATDRTATDDDEEPISQRQRSDPAIPIIPKPTSQTKRSG